MTSNSKTTVIFRAWHKNHAYPLVIALFPYVKYDLYGYRCLSYMHVGQHGGADYNAVISETRPATPEEWQPLAEELTSIGYNLRVRQKRLTRKEMNED